MRQVHFMTECRSSRTVPRLAGQIVVEIGGIVLGIMVGVVEVEEVERGEEQECGEEGDEFGEKAEEEGLCCCCGRCCYSPGSPRRKHDMMIFYSIVSCRLMALAAILLRTKNNEGLRAIK
mmetsp:Transcript_7050/g.15569  ORF Transcript_7050/g.15569 Transcript_7050/m.15569 type:complete len:120 (+) Transcript_7050:306-665(+)